MLCARKHDIHAAAWGGESDYKHCVVETDCVFYILTLASLEQKMFAQIGEVLWTERGF